MTSSSDRIGTVGQFMQLLTQRSMSRYLEFEGFLTGGLYWRIKAWCAERNLAKNTAGVYEATGEEFESKYESWQDLVYQVRFGAPLTKKGRKATRRLVDDGIAESKIRTWIINEHMDEDGNLKPRYRRIADQIVRSLAWIWHGLVVATAFLFVVYTWSLPGPIWNKIAVTIGLVFFFLMMSALMNSTSLSALPPRTRPID